jgi:hypothetical protein
MVISYIEPWGQLARLRAYDDAVARRAFDTPNSYVIGGAVPGYAVTPVRMFPGFENYAKAAAFGGWCCFDLEAWEASPMLDKQHPKSAYAHFIQLAQARGNPVIASPSRDLVYVGGADDRILPGEDLNTAYLRCQIPACGAGAQVLLVQAQNVQKDLAAFTTLIEGAAAQQVPGSGQALWVGLTTAYSTADQMVAAHNAVVGDVTGFWVTIAAAEQVPVAAEFFKQVLPA